MSRKHLLTLGSILIILSMVLSACAQATPAPTEAPAEPMATEAPAEPMETEAPAEPMETEAPAEPMETEAPAEPMEESVFIFGRGGDSVSLDPALVTDGESFRVTGQCLHTPRWGCRNFHLLLRAQPGWRWRTYPWPGLPGRAPSGC